MNLIENQDEEALLFLHEMREGSARQKREQINNDIRRIQSKTPYPVESDTESVRWLVKRSNTAAGLIREFLAQHPEDTDLTRRAHNFIERTK